VAGISSAQQGRIGQQGEVAPTTVVQQIVVGCKLRVKACAGLGSDIRVPLLNTAILGPTVRLADPASLLQSPGKVTCPDESNLTALTSRSKADISSYGVFRSSHRHNEVNRVNPQTFETAFALGLYLACPQAPLDLLSLK
jgi:hypothetical protein